MTNDINGQQDPNTLAEDKTLENDVEEFDPSHYEGMEEDGLKKVRSLFEQRKKWKESAIDPDTGKKWRDVVQDLKRNQTPTTDKTDKNDKGSSLKTEPNEVDYGNLAFYNTKSDVMKIESDNDIDYLRETMKETGKSQQAILGSKWFQAELSERRQMQETANATPTATKRTSAPAGDDVHTIAERVKAGEMSLNDIGSQELRFKVNNHMINQDNEGRPFYNS